MVSHYRAGKIWFLGTQNYLLLKAGTEERRAHRGFVLFISSKDARTRDVLHLVSCHFQFLYAT